MLDGYHIITLTHHDAPLQALRHAIIEDGQANILPALKLRFEWKELYYLATCNRVMYLFYHQGPLADDLISGVLRTVQPDLSDDQVLETSAQMRLLHGAEAVQHLFEVAASMDSLVLGEREIVRQLREAYDRNHAQGLTGDHLRLLLRFTIETAKEVYTQTGIGEKSLSVVALAFNAMLRAGVSPNDRILMLGAGITNTLFGRFLSKYGFKNIAVSNRSYENGRVLAEKLGGKVLPFNTLSEYTEGFDALVVCTAATQAIVTPALYAALLQGDAGKKVVVDLSVPHNVDAQVVQNFDVAYIEIEGLRSVAEEHRSFREQECAKAAILIQERIFAYRDLWHERQVERAMAHIPDEVRAVKDRAINEVFAKDFAALDPQAQATVRKMLEYMEKKCVAIPIKAAKAIALRGKKQTEKVS